MIVAPNLHEMASASPGWIYCLKEVSTPVAQSGLCAGAG